MKVIKQKKRLMRPAVVLKTPDFKRIGAVIKLVQSSALSQLPGHICRVRKSEALAEVLLGLGKPEDFAELTIKLPEFIYEICTVDVVVDGLELTDCGWNYKFSSVLARESEEISEISRLSAVCTPLVHLLDFCDIVLLADNTVLALVSGQICYKPDEKQILQIKQLKKVVDGVEKEHIDIDSLKLPAIIYSPLFALPRIKDVYLPSAEYSLTGLTVLCREEPDALEAGALLHARVKEVVYAYRKQGGCLNEEINYGNLKGSNHHFKAYML